MMGDDDLCDLNSRMYGRKVSHIDKALKLTAYLLQFLPRKPMSTY